MADATNPRDLLYGGREDQSVRAEPPAAPTPERPRDPRSVRRIVQRAEAFVHGLNQLMGTCWPESGGLDMGQIAEIADQHGLEVAIDGPPERRRIHISVGTDELGVALWRDWRAAIGSGQWELYVKPGWRQAYGRRL